MHPSKTMIRVCGCTNYSETSMDTHVQFYILLDINLNAFFFLFLIIDEFGYATAYSGKRTNHQHCKAEKGRNGSVVECLTRDRGVAGLNIMMHLIFNL